MRTLIIVMLILIASIFFLTSVSAEITIDGEIVHVETNNYKVQFDRGVMSYIHNKRTAETYTIPESNGIEAQTAIMGRHAWTWASYSEVELGTTGGHSATLFFRQGGNEITLTIEVEPTTGDLLIAGSGESDTFGVYGFQWGCDNIDINNLDFILPANGGQVITASTPFESKWYSYPASWEAQLAIFEGEQGGFFVRTADETFPYQQLIWEKNSGELAVNFQTHNQAPWDALNTVQSVVWRFNTYVGDYRVPARIHRYWMEEAFQPWRLADMPNWVEDIGLVIMVGSPDLMGRELDMASALAEEVDPSKTLLYLVDWCEYRYATYLPDYTPSEGFGGFIKAVHEMGYRVMLHTNLVGMSTYHPLYPDFQAFQFRNPRDGRLMGWRWDELEEPRRHAWINNASSNFRDLLVSRLKQVWEEHGVDAFHLDISHVVTNDANGLIEGLNSQQGNVLMHKQLAEAMPGVVFSGEHLHEVTFFRESFAQRWKQWQGFTPHPISSFLFGPYTRPYGYLGLPAVSGEQAAEYHLYLDSYESWGVLPTLWSWDLQLHRRPYAPLTQEILAVARQWQDLGLRPDFESDWGLDTLFQYTTQTGEIVTYQRTPAGTVFILPNDTGYERVYGVTQVQTHRSLPHWRAYNETNLLGLDPNRSYLLDNTPRDLSQAHINSLPPGVSVTETRVTENAALFRLEKTNISLDIDLLSKLYLVKTGIVLNGTELPLQRGGTFRHSQSTISGVTKPAIHAHPFYQDGSGDTFGEFTLHMPDSPDIHLEFYMGLWEGSERSDGVTFVVSVQGDEIFRQHYNQQRWESVNLNLSPYRGQIVKLRFTTTPGPNEDAGWDWAVWGEPKIISVPDRSTTVGCFLPAEPIGSYPNPLQRLGQGNYILETDMSEPFIIFLTPPQQVNLPYNLRDAQFTAGLQFDNIFRLGSVWNSGNRTTVESPNGERKPSISAQPPANGQTILQFPLLLPERPSIFSFSTVLPGECSEGVVFQVRLNGQTYFDTFKDTLDWTDDSISLSQFAGQPLLLELVTDPAEAGSAGPDCDHAHWADLHITAAPNPDANLDGEINVLDLILVASSFGEEPPSNPQADTNKDGVVNIFDLVFVAEHLSQNATAPSQLTFIESIPSSAKEVIAAQRALTELEAIPNKSHGVRLAIELLRHYLSIAARNVQETKLLPNYPNPFNPETWIPYQLSQESTVAVKIYDVSGHLVRTIEVGHKPMGYYLTRQRAVYWDGRNQNGEPISSGVYFYTLNTDTYTQTRRMVIVK